MDNDHSSPTLTNVVFINNRSEDAGGGGMGNTNDSNPILVDVTFSGNSAYWYGGGMWNTFSNPTLTNVTFINNSAYNGGGTNTPKGGGIYKLSQQSNIDECSLSKAILLMTAVELLICQDSNPTLTNVTFSDNSAQGNGEEFTSMTAILLSKTQFSGAIWPENSRRTDL